MVRIDTGTLGSDFYLPPMPNATELIDRPDVGVCAGQLAVRANAAIPESDGAVVAQWWHGREPDIWGKGWIYYEQARNLHLLGELTGLTRQFEFAGIRTKMVEVPSSRRRPASTLIAMTYSTPEIFCERANSLVADARIAGVQPRFILNRARDPRYSGKTYLNDLAYPQLRISESDLLGFMFRVHDQVEHGPAMIAALLRAPLLVDRIRARAIKLRSKPYHHSNKEISNFLDVIDTTMTPSTLVRTALGDTDNPGMNDLAAQGVRIAGGVEKIGRLLIAKKDNRVHQLHAA